MGCVLGIRKITLQPGTFMSYIRRVPRVNSMSDATVMLAAVNAGDSKAAQELLELVYDELRRLAASSE